MARLLQKKHHYLLDYCCGYEGFDEEDIADTEMFAETRESRLICNILRDYLDIHPHARDGFSMAVYRNEDIQPVISAVHTFLSELAEGDMPVLGRQEIDATL